VIKIVKSHSRGHEIYHDGLYWRFTDDDSIANYERPCKRCGILPTKEGYDACLGHIDGATFACCGHGVDEKYIKY
jgi:hypothetical protein